MVTGGVDRQADDLDVAQVELGLDLGHVAELGGADRGEVLGVREQNPPGIPEPVVEVDRPFARLGLEVRSGIADSQWHWSSSSWLPQHPCLARNSPPAQFTTRLVGNAHPGGQGESLAGEDVAL